MAPLVTINNHTTSSNPRPHILYTVQVTLNGRHSIIDKRYSEFVSLHENLKDKFSIPPKRLLVTTFLPSAWVDDALIAERKANLAEYLSNLLQAPEYKDNPTLLEFLLPDRSIFPRKIDLEDVVPSTLSRRAAFDVEVQELEGIGTEAMMIAAAYYPDWSVNNNPPEGIDFSKFDIIFFAFAMPNSSSGLSWDSSGQSILQRLVTSARSSGWGTKIVLSVGGWGGSYWFSQTCSTSANRTIFTNALVNAVNTYGLDGIDIDWEYPNSPGAGNPYSSADAANLLNLFSSLRSALGSSKVISAAVPHMPWLGSNGSHLTNVSAYAAQLTYVNIMNYDVWGVSSTPGPNAPLGNLCGTSTQPQASAQAALSQWTVAGFPASQLLLGLPLYGYVSQSTMTTLTGSLLPSPWMVLLQQNEGTSAAGESKMHFLNGAHARPELSEVRANASLTAWWGQQIPFSSIVSSGALVKGSDGNYTEGGGFTMGWDNCSDTPFLYNVSQQTVVTYDDTWSLADKATFSRQNGMAGCFTWSLDQDDGLTLQNVIRTNLGK